MHTLGVSLARVPVTVIVHTKNEETNLPFAMVSVASWADQVLLVDSDSSDRTQEIARSYGAEVISRACDRRGLVEQRNWALESDRIRNNWVFILDADEEMTAELAAEVADIVSRNADDVDGYWCRFKVIFGGRWVRRTSLYPTWSMRLFRRHVRYERRQVNAHPVVAEGKEGYLKAHFLTEDRRPFRVMVDRMNDFSSLEAEAYRDVHVGRATKDVIPGRLFGSHAERRRWLKNVYIRLPSRPIVMFLYLFILRRGFLDGRAGLDFALYKAVSEWLTGVKMREQKRVAGFREARDALLLAKSQKRSEREW